MTKLNTLHAITWLILSGIILSFCLSEAMADSMNPGIKTSNSGTVTFFSYGDSRIYKDPLAAKNDAITESIVQALYSVSCRILSPDAVSSYFESTSSIITKNPYDYITGYRIIREYKTRKEYRALIQVSVAKDKLEKKFIEAGILIPAASLPPVLVMVAQKGADDIEFDYWWKHPELESDSMIVCKEIARIFSQKGFHVLPCSIPEGLMDKIAADIPAQALCTDIDAATLALKLGAGIVITGKAEAYALPNTIEKRVGSYKCDISIRAVKCDTGEAIATVFDDAVDISDAPDFAGRNVISKAAEKAATRLAERIIASYQAYKAEPDSITVRVEGQNILPHLEIIRNVLKNMDKTDSVKTEEMTPDSAVLSVGFRGTAQELAEKLLVQPFIRFGIEITDVTTDTLVIELTAK